jgi:uncharacterized membrane protein YfcA
LIWLEFALTGILAGFLAGYLGIGGGLVLVPALTWLLSRDLATSDYAVHMAVATSLSTMLVTSLSSILAHHRRGAINWPIVRQFTPTLLLGAMGGALVADRLSSPALGSVFGTFALVVGIYLLAGHQPSAHRGLPGPSRNGTAGMVFGAISSLVGIGGGSMTVPWLLWHGMRAQQAVATAAACGYPIALAGTAGFVWLGADAGTGKAALGYVYLPAFIGISVFSMLAAPLGAAAVHRSPPGIVRRIFGLFLLLVAARMLAGWLT